MTVAVLGAAGLTACSSNSSSPTTTAAPTTTGGSSSPSSSAAPPSTAPSTTTAGLSSCAAADLTGAIAGSSGAAGTIETTVALKNTTAKPCTLAGYPGLLLHGPTGAALPTNVVRKGSYSFTAMAPTTVTVSPGGSAYFNIGYSDVPVGGETTCASSVSLGITPPNAYDQLMVPATLAACGGGMLVVSPVFLDTGSNSQSTAPPGG
jgi:hypothetical protein